MAWFKRGKTQTPAAGTPVLPPRRPLVMALEPRVMFDGAAFATVAALQPEAAAHAPPAAHADADHAPAMHRPAAMWADHVAPGAFRFADHDGAAPSAPRNVLFVDARIQDAASLLAHVRPGTEVVYLQQGRDGLAQMRDYLDAHPGADSVQILAHGNDGDLWLGNTYLSSDNIGQHASDLQQIGADIKAGGDILIYACDTADGDKGMAFVTSLAQLTHRDIAASDNRTGAGADWNLEIATGQIESLTVLSATDQTLYAHDLATLTVTTSADSGAGSLRATIAAATSGDTITFASSMTIGLSTHASGDSLLVINKNLTIEGDIDGNGTADVTLDGQYNGRVLDITAGSTVALDGLVIEHGLLSGDGGNGISAAALNGGDALGAGIRNAGTLTLKDVTITGNRAAGGGGASFTPSNNANHSTGGATYGFGGGGGGGYAGIGGGDGGAANLTDPSGAAATLGTGGVGGTGGQSFDYGAHGYGGGGGSTSGGLGAYQASTLGGGSGGTAGGIGGGGGGWGNTGGASGRGGDAAGGIFNTGTLTIRHSNISNNAAAGGGGAGPSYSSGLTYAAGSGGVAAGGILNRGDLQIDTATIASFSANAAAGGERGQLGGADSSHPAASSQSDSMNDSGGTTTTLPSASITNATYDAATGVLTVTGADMAVGDTVNAGKLTLTGQGGSSYTLTSGNTTASSATSFSITLNAADKLAINGLLNKNGASAVDATPFNLAAAANWDATASASADLTGNGVTVSNVIAPAVTSATYDAGTHVLTVTGSNLVATVGANNDITVSRLTLTGEGGATYTLTSSSVEVTSATSFAVTLNAADQAALGRILNKIGTSSTGGTTYNLAAADDWDSVIGNADTSDLTGNSVTVSNVPTPTITSATYDASTGSLVVTGSGFLSLSGAVNDIVANKFTFTAEGGATYTLTDTANVEITSGTRFTLSLSATDKAAINQIVTKNGTSSTGGTTYNLAAAEDWAAGADPAIVTADTAGNGITASNVAVPAITGATYDAATGQVVVTGTGFLSSSGATNDIVANRFTFTGKGGATYTLTDTANVEITSGTSFTLSLSATDKAALDQIVDKNGTSSTGGTTYNLAAAEDWAAGADAAVTLADTTGNGVTASNVEATPVVTASGVTTAFVEGTPAAVDGGLTLSDADNTTLVSATVALTGGFHSGQDVLSFINDGSTMGNITASYNAGTGVMTLASAGGTATLAQWQAALRSVTYTDIAQDPDAATRTVSFTLNDGTRDSAVASKAVSVTGVNDAPMLTTTVDASPQFTEGGAAVTLFTGTTISTVEAGQNIHALTVTVGGLADGGSEILNVDGTAVALTDGNIVTTATNGYAVSVTLSGGTATVTITRVGDYSASAAQALVNGLSYRNTSDNPTVAGGRTITLAGVQDTGGNANGGADTGSPGIAGTVLIQTINDAPVATASGGAASFVAGDNVSGTPVVVDGGITVTDADNTALATATIAITGGFRAGEDVLGFINDGATMGNIAASYDASTGVLTLTSSGGTATLAQWQAALRSVTYTDTAITPDAATRTVSFAISDGIDSSATVTRAVTVTAVDQTPIVTTTGGTTNYVGGTTAVTIDGGITVSDLDSTTQSSATISIGAGFSSGDVLGFVNDAATMGNITASYNAATGVLTLTSSGATATNAQWANALSAVTFASTSTSYGNRTIDFATSDGSKTSVAAVDTVDVLGPPQITTDSGSATFVAGDNTASTPVAIDAGLSVTDGVSTTLASATIAITGNFHGGEDVLLFTNNGSTMGNIVASYNAATGVLTMTSAGSTATLAQWQSALESVRYTDTAVTPNTATRTVSFTAVDGSGITSNTATRTITVTAVDQTPIVTTTGGTTDYVYSAAPITIDGGIAVSDLDNTTQSSATVSIGAGFASGDVLGFVNDAATMGNITASYNVVTGVLTLTSSGATATNAQWANALSSVTFSSTSTSYGNRTIDFTTSDGSKTSAIATDTVNLLGLPKVTDVSSSTPDGNYKIGDTIYLTVSFDQSVVVDGAGGTPTLLMETGGVDRAASYVSGSGSNTLTFAYTVQAGDASADLDYASTAALALNGGTIRSGAGTDAVLTLPVTGGASSVAGQHAIVVDGIAPTVASVDVPANGTYVAGQHLDFTVNYSDAITVDTSGGTPRIAITLDTGGTVYADYVSGSGTTALVFRYTVATGQADPTGIALAGAIDANGGVIRDAVGNAEVAALNGVSSTSAVLVDAVAPTASIVVADTALAAGEASQVTITFSEAVSGLTITDFTVANGSFSSLASSDGGRTWTATLTPTANVTDASNLIVLDNSGVQDAAGNTGLGSTTSNNYAIDTDRPTASIVVADTALKAGETSQVTITFSEAVSGLATTDFTVANGTLSGLASSDGGLTWTATLTPAIDVANAGNTIALDVTGVIDAAGNTGVGSVASNVYAIDTARPTATIVVADTALKAGETSQVTITFSEAVSGLTTTDFTVANGSLSGLASSDGGVTWKAVFTPGANVTATSDTITLDTAGVTDAAGNTGAGSVVSNGYAIDTARPTASIVVADTALKAGETSQVTITFSEAVSGLTTADFTVANGSLSSLASNDGGHTWTATLTPTVNVTDASNLIVLDNTGVQDAAGNIGLGSTASNNYAIDTARPTASIVVADTALKAGETSQVSITFSEAVSGLTTADFTVANGALSDLTSSDGGLTWTATLTPAVDVANASNTITLDATGVVDVAGNTGAGSVISNAYAIDTARPTAAIVVADTALKAGETSQVTITFSEAVSGLTTTDFTVANGSLSGLASSDGGVTWTAVFTPGANVTATSNTITLDTAGVTDAAGNTGAGSVMSNAYAVDTHAPQLVTISRADASPTSGQQGLDYTVTFDEDVSGLDAADLKLVLTGNARATIGSVTRVDGHTFTVHLVDVGGTGSVQLDLAAGSSGIVDLAGNALAAGRQGEAYVVGGVAPVVLTTTASSPVAPTAGYRAVVPSLAPVTRADLSTIYFGEAAPPRTFDLPFETGGVLDALATRVAGQDSASGAAWAGAWSNPPPIAAASAFRVPLPAGDVLQVSMADGRPLPPWLVFDPVAGTLSGTTPRDFAETLSLLLTVRDGQGDIREVPVQLSAGKTAPAHGEGRPTASRPALAAQFGQQRHGADHAALLRQLAVAQRHVHAPVRP